MARPLRGEIRWADLLETRGREQAGPRPVLVVSQDLYNDRSGTVIASIPANVVNDAASNGNAAASSIDNSVTFSRRSVYLPLVTVVQNSDAQSVARVMATSVTPTREER